MKICSMLIVAVGLGPANEVLIWGKKKTAEELAAVGFIK